MTTETEAVEATQESKERDFHMVAVSIPIDLHEQLEAAAQEQKISLTVLARRAIANVTGYDISNFERTRRRGRVKYANEDERKAAVAKAQAERAATVRLLMERYASGEIQLSEDEIQDAIANAPKRTKSTEKATK